MLRRLGTTGLMLLAAAWLAAGTAAHAQIGTIFSDPPLRPPGNIPGSAQPDYDAEEDVPELPQQGRVLPAPNQFPRGQGVAPPGPVQTQPLPPPPGTTVVPRNAPGTATAPPAQHQQPPQQQPAPTQGAKAAPPSPATLQPGDEIVTAPPAQKIVNKKAVFSGLDKITGRITSFDTDIGETVQFGALRVKADACFTRPATEAANTDAFVEVDEITLQGEVKRIFSGWMFAASPGLHGVEHPVYDVWLTDCKEPEATVAASEPAPAPAPRAAPAPQQKRVQRAPAPQPPPRQPSLLPPFQQ
ncbi:MAG: DUF2155 domain-containing protein [Proteobacteria bacterium]|nr:MAG: DUF2155 domain-containing protein [Pseudomonadota bacterium]